jgi:HSP20 family molecular chaperone IbpA
MGIPPSVRRSGPNRPAGAAAGQARPSGKQGPRGRYPQPRPPKVHISPETPAQLSVDVFDEGSRIVVLAEAPGLAAGDVAVSLEGTVLVISVQAPHRSGIQRIELPCEVAGDPEVTLANGILTIQVRKADAK